MSKAFSSTIVCAFFTILLVMLTSARGWTQASGNDGANPVATIEPAQVRYQYDDLGRLIRTENLRTGVVHTYRYDPAGNRTVHTVSGFALPIVRILNAKAREGEDTIDFKVSLSYAAEEDIVVNWRSVFSDNSVGSANASDISTPHSGELVIPRGFTEGVISFNVIDDTIKEGDETFSIELTEVEGANLDDVDQEATGLIYDNDLIYFDFADGIVSEGEAFEFEVRKHIPAGGVSNSALTVNLRTIDGTAQQAAGDFGSLVNASMSFPAATFIVENSIFATSDDLVEGQEVFLIELKWVVEGFISTYVGIVTIEDPSGDNTGGDSTGGDNTGGDNTGGDNTGGDNTDGGNSGPGNRAPTANDDAVTYELQIVSVIGGNGERVFVNPNDPAPELRPGETPLFDGSAVFNVLGNDTDPDGDLLTVTAVSVASGYPVPHQLDVPDVALGIEPLTNGRTGIRVGFNGCAVYGFDYTVADPDGLTSSAQLFITVTGEGGENCPPPSVPVTPPTEPKERPTVTLERVSAETVKEGKDNKLEYDIVLSNTFENVVVYWEVSGTASAGSDYVDAPSKRISFGNKTKQRIKVDLLSDADVVEDEETLVLTLTQAENADLGEAISISTTIEDDDVRGNRSPILFPDYYTGIEINPIAGPGLGGSEGFEGGLEAGTLFQGSATLDLLSNDEDPDDDAMTLLPEFDLIDGFKGNGSISLVNGEALFLGTECGRYRFSYKVEDAHGAVSTSFVEIRTTQPDGCPIAEAPLDEEIPTASIAAANSRNEGLNLEFPVSLTHAYSAPVQITWNVTEGAADVIETSGVLIFNPSDALTKNIIIPTVNDGQSEADERVTVRLDANRSNASIGTASASGTILNDDVDPPAFSVSDVNITEGGSSASFTITRANPGSGTNNVNFSIVDGTAIRGEDYNATEVTGTLTFAPGITSQSVTVTPLTDDIFERDQLFYINLTNPTGGAIIADGQGVGTVLNTNGIPVVNVFNNGRQEGNSNSVLTMTIFLQGGTTEPVTLTYQTTNGSALEGQDYIAVPPTTITIQPGEYEHQFPVTIIGDTVFENDEHFNVIVSGVVNAATVTSNINQNNPTKGTNGVGNIRNDDYSYSWRQGGWSSYSACSSGGVRTQTRTVYCRRSDGSTVSDSFCGGGKPQSTNSDTCTPRYSDGPVSWPSTCPPSGEQRGTYVRTCSWVESGNSCGSSTITVTRGCNYVPSYTYSWQTGGWSSYSACSSSGVRTQTRAVYCRRSDGSTVSDSFCGGGKPQPTRSDTCTPPVTYTYSFQYSAFAGWPACTGQATRQNVRTATCKRSDGATVSNSFCGTPDLVRTDTCTYSWSAGSWSPWTCSGLGDLETRQRQVVCRSESGATVSNGICSGAKPESHQSRQNSSCSFGGGFPF
ncbi:hypothetical protein KFE96_00110 [Kordiimonas sp. SCSIO 12603]|uniref:Calx-beta domain-containing protein n=1 Tax=Kordiimonas sp. SCSIO 12603 TaxID=2829596 RepID=UPI002105FF64|nr:Calx-beta domain-containing protein [Kordiimonas sp. SCSIO 12603]UTW58745.1 hypothetical protein KFE96_00110 [Kordiimonas sp. SCSIO 12603]